VIIRSVVALVASFAILLASSLGLNRGMVFVAGHDGHLELVSAHDRHADKYGHGGGADHHHGDGTLPVDGEHAQLHDAMAKVAEAEAGTPGQFAASQFVASPADLLPHVHFVATSPDLRPFAGGTGILAAHFWGSTARIELASIRAIVLLV
jgi:hypothetical protein